MCCTSGIDSTGLLQEDAHCAVLEVDPENQTGFFGVFDGHGGQEVAKYCSLRMVCPHKLKGVVDFNLQGPVTLHASVKSRRSGWLTLLC